MTAARALPLARCSSYLWVVKRKPHRKPYPGLSRYPDAAGLWALLALDDLKLDLGALVEAGATQVIGVDKHVLAARVRCDEAEALVCIEKLNRTGLHASPIPRRHWGSKRSLP